MKRIFSTFAALAMIPCLCLGLAPLSSALSDPRVADATSAGLKTKSDGSFKIIQISDTQDFILSCELTQDFIYFLAESERPDLFVLTGDNVATNGASWMPKSTAKYFVRRSVENLMRVFDKIYKDFGIPMTMVYGNHDNEAGPDKVSRAQQFAMYAAHPCFIGYYVEQADKGTGASDDQGDRYGTHNLIIKDKTGKKPKFNLWMFDSGSYDPAGGYASVQPQQIAWFKAENAKTGKLPSFAFQHIVVPEIYDLLTVCAPDEEKAYSRDFIIKGKQVTKSISKQLPAGVKGAMREAPGPGIKNHGQYAAFNSADNVHAMFFGHDHVNTYEVRPKGKTDLINSPCSGFGSYGDIDMRGARVITLNENDPSGYETKLVTFEDFSGAKGLSRARLKMYQNLGTFGTVVDAVTFDPLLKIADRFDR